MEITKDNKKKLTILAIIGGVCMTGLVALNFVGGDKEEPEEQRGNIYAEIQDPDTEDLQGSKIDGGGTRNENITGWWDDLGEVESDESSSSSSAGEVVPTEDFVTGDQRTPDQRAQDALGYTGNTLTAEQLRAILEEGNGGSSSRSSSGSSSQSYSRPANPATSAAPVAQPEAPATPVASESGSSASAAEEDRITIGTPTTQIRRSSPISSFEDDWTTADGGSGVSSFGNGNENVSQDERHPFKCMFVKQEKLTNGQRVTVRLLEDIVVGGVVITANSHLTAICKIDERLELSVASYERNGTIYSLDYEAYDNDGLKGIYCPSLSGAKDQVTNDASNMVNTYAGSRIGRVAQDVLNSSIQIFRSAKGEVTVSVPQGYTFFIVKRKVRSSTTHE